MPDTNPSLVPLEAAFADAAQAERAVTQLQQHGVPPDRIDVGRGGTDRPGQTAAQDQTTATRLADSWFGGVLVGAIVGGLIGAVIGALTFGAATPGFWGLALGAGGGGAGVGALWGMFAGFTRRNTRRPMRSELTDAVRVRAVVEPDQLDVARRVVREHGGTL